MYSMHVEPAITDSLEACCEAGIEAKEGSSERTGEEMAEASKADEKDEETPLSSSAKSKESIRIQEMFQEDADPAQPLPKMTQVGLVLV